MAGFFTHTVARSKSIPLLPQCGICGLFKSCNSPKMPVSGEGRRKVLLCGEAPGQNEDDQNTQFVGDSGQLLEKFLRKIGVSMRKDCWITNSVVCHPSRNELPDKAVDYCRPNLIQTVNKLKPEVIILLGSAAIRSLLQWLWKEDSSDAVSLWAGWRIPCQKINAWICPTWHPSYIMRIQNAREGAAAELLFEKHLRAAFDLKSRPWGRTIDYKSGVMPYLDLDLATAEIESMTRNSRAVAFDYETDSRKPDCGGQIVSCSMSNGRETIAYPWQGKVKEATQQFLLSDVPKIASNIQFEERQTRVEFGHGVKNWKWDTMLAAHALDSRPGITSIKFLSFALLGQEDYDSDIKPYLEAKDSYAKNRVFDIPINDLLYYNCLDALFEYKVAQIQMRQMGVDYDKEAVQECTWL